MALIGLTAIRCIDYLAFGSIFTCVTFCPKNELDFYFAKKSIDDRWEVVDGLVSFLVLGIFSNVNSIFNPVVATICCRNLHRQPISHSTRLDDTRLLVELYIETRVFFIELQSFEKALCTMLNSAKGV
jgi:hypothetical protein